MLLQSDKSDFILAIIKKVKSHESRSHWTLIENSEVKNKHRNKDGNINTILSIWYFKRKRFTDGRLVKQKARLCARGGMQQ